MPGPKRGARMYYREGRGWYADFRNYRDVGGGQEALKPEGSHRATENQAQAALIFAQRLQYLQDRRAGRIAAPRRALMIPTLGEYLDRHFELKAGRVRAETSKRDRTRLERLVTLWDDPRLDSIDTRHINDLVLRYERQGNAPQTINHVVNSLSSLLQNAVAEGYLPTNPARGAKRPRVRRAVQPWLESAEGHRLLVAAEELAANQSFRGVRCIHALLATALLTGGRKREVFALLVSDVDFNNGVIHFRPNRHYPERKSRHSIRQVPLWPQLRAVLVPFVGDRERGLLFTSVNGQRLNDVRESLAAVFAQAKIAKPAGKEWHLFRHTYTAMRIQTLDSGHPVSLWTVKEELGHGSVTQIEQTYGHLLKVRTRLDRVEYRPLQDADRESLSA